MHVTDRGMQSRHERYVEIIWIISFGIDCKSKGLPAVKEWNRDSSSLIDWRADGEVLQSMASFNFDWMAPSNVINTSLLPDDRSPFVIANSRGFAFWGSFSKILMMTAVASSSERLSMAALVLSQDVVDVIVRGIRGGVGAKAATTELTDDFSQE